jgi:DNA helicase-2/ATP-dependent DNA helicase PcrA
VTTTFEEQYSKLNAEQKLAVDTIEGPVMVVAGPGTGKTQILTMRIANILNKTQMNPRNILALTFTDSAAANMRARLVGIVGPPAYGVGIYTFHGFANLVITEFPYKFQFARELKSIDEIEQIEIIEGLIDSLALEELRPVRAPYFYTREILSRIGDLKKEAMTPSGLRELVESEKERLTNDPGSTHEKGPHKGKTKAAVVEELKHLARCGELADLYEGYQSSLAEKGLYDYDDMVLFVVDALENDFELKSYYQERFQYVLVDEYQDTNNSQNRLIALLTDFFEEPNLFVVGDDKQSIFRFQGASMANMVLFFKKFPSMKVISLTENYRSLQPILDVSHALISNATERITDQLSGVSDQLSSNLKTTDGIPISLAVLKNPDIEHYYVAHKVKELVTAGAEPDEIAIIYKENREAEGYADLLGRLGVPYTLQRGSDVLVDQDVRRLLTILRTIDNPTDSRLLFEILHYDFMKVNGIDLLKLMSYRAKSHISLIDTLDNPEEAKLMEPERIKEIYAKIGEWRIESANLSMPELLEKVVEESGMLAQISDSPNRIERFHRLRRFFDEVKRVALQTTGLTLDELLRRIDLLISNKIQLVPEILDTDNAGGAVRLMTAHRAKGLEFSHVFIPNLVDKHWGNASRRTLIKLPSSIIGQYRPAQDEKNEDERRLLYVALTRAKQCLYLSYATSKNGKEMVASQFLSELGEEVVTPADTTHIEKESGAHLLALFTPVADAIFTDQEAEYLRTMIREQPITPTGLNNYLRCPKGYLYKNLLRVPTAKTASQGYGTAIHAAMQAFFMKHKATKHVPSLDELLEAFHASLSKEILSAKEFAEFHKLGCSVLEKYYEQNLRAVTPTVAVEYSFDPHHVTLEGEDGPIFITGRLDKIELLDPASNAVRVIDYKTGRARSRNEIEGKTASADEDYKRQLIFYQMLADTDRQFPYKVKETGLAFVDDDCRFPTEYFTITREEVGDLKELIKNVYKQMLSLEFPHYEDPNKPPCEFCDI